MTIYICLSTCLKLFQQVKESAPRQKEYPIHTDGKAMKNSHSSFFPKTLHDKTPQTKNLSEAEKQPMDYKKRSIHFIHIF